MSFARYVETLVRVTYRSIIPFYLHVFEFAYLVFNILCDKLVNPKVKFLLKKRSVDKSCTVSICASVREQDLF